MYTQSELQTPVIFENQNQFSQLAQQIAQYVSRGGKITVLESEHRFATVEELTETGYRLSKPQDLYRQKHS